MLEIFERLSKGVLDLGKILTFFRVFFKTSHLPGYFDPSQILVWWEEVDGFLNKDDDDDGSMSIGEGDIGL